MINALLFFEKRGIFRIFADIILNNEYMGNLMIGDTYPPNIQLGESAVSKIMCGSEQVWPKNDKVVDVEGTFSVAVFPSWERVHVSKDLNFQIIDGYTGDVATACDGTLTIYQKVMTDDEMRTQLPKYREIYGWNFNEGTERTTISGEYNVLFFKFESDPGYRIGTLVNSPCWIINQCINNNRYPWAESLYTASDRTYRYEWIAIHRSFWKDGNQPAYYFSELPYEGEETYIPKIDALWAQEQR